MQVDEVKQDSHDLDRKYEKHLASLQQQQMQQQQKEQ